MSHSKIKAQQALAQKIQVELVQYRHARKNRVDAPIIYTPWSKHIKL